MIARLIEVNHVVEHGMVTYQGLPAPEITDFLSREDSRQRYADGTEFHIGRISMVANTGTYVDAPSHRFADGQDLSTLPLESVAHVPGVVVRVQGQRAIGKNLLERIDAQNNAVLIHTGWDRHWRTEAYFQGHPFLTRDAAEWLVEQGATLVGIDSYNIDDTSDPSRPAHTELLKAGIPVCEHLCHLDRVPERGFYFYAVPVRIKNFGSFPVRAFVLADRPS